MLWNEREIFGIALALIQYGDPNLTLGVLAMATALLRPDVVELLRRDETLVVIKAEPVDVPLLVREWRIMGG